LRLWPVTRTRLPQLRSCACPTPTRLDPLVRISSATTNRTHGGWWRGGLMLHLLRRHPRPLQMTMRPVLNPEGVKAISPGSKPARSVATTRGLNHPLRSTRYPQGRQRCILLSLKPSNHIPQLGPVEGVSPRKCWHLALLAGRWKCWIQARPPSHMHREYRYCDKNYQWCGLQPSRRVMGMNTRPNSRLASKLKSDGFRRWRFGRNSRGALNPIPRKGDDN